MKESMKVLVVDVGGTNVKILATGQSRTSGVSLGADDDAERWSPESRNSLGMEVRCGIDWLSRVRCSREVVAEPHNLAPGGSGSTLGRLRMSSQVINDAAMQALGSYQGGEMLFLGLGTGLGSALIVDGIVVPMELGHLPYREGTYEDYVGVRGDERGTGKRNGGSTSRTLCRLIAASNPTRWCSAEAMSKN